MPRRSRTRHRHPDALDRLEIAVSRAIAEATADDLREALDEERLPEPASHVIQRGGARLIAIGEERARREIDRRFAEVLAAIVERDRRIDTLESQVAELLDDGG